MKKTQPNESMPRKVGPLNKMAMDAALDTPLVNHRLRATARFCHAEVSKQFTLVWAARGCSISICKTCFSSLSGGQRMMFVHDAPPARQFCADPWSTEIREVHAPQHIGWPVGQFHATLILLTDAKATTYRVCLTVRDQEVDGSNPFAPTISSPYYNSVRHAFLECLVGHFWRRPI